MDRRDFQKYSTLTVPAVSALGVAGCWGSGDATQTMAYPKLAGHLALPAEDAPLSKGLRA
jgi:hypothetical protein